MDQATERGRTASAVRIGLGDGRVYTDVQSSLLSNDI